MNPALAPDRRAGPRLLAALCLAALAWLLAACPAQPPEWPEDEGFDDHTVARVASLAQFDELAATAGTGTAALKFVIVGFGDPREQTVRYLDGRFYAYHDEWYWFRLVNGQRIPGSRERPLSGESFPTVAELVDWVRTRRAPPPLGMRFVDGRLYSDYFYELAIHRERRSIGIGTIIHLPARFGAHPRDELWGFELEYGDELEEPDLERFFAALRASLPPAIAEQLTFVARSPAQVELVNRLRRHEHALAEHLTSYAELAVPGEVEVYNPGLIAGRLRKLPSDPETAAKLLTAGDPRVIWMVPAVPDELPPAAGLLTAVPQTPLAHVNLLARNRGIPNVYIGGLLDDPQLDQLARVHAPVVLLAEVDGRVTLEPIGEQAYGRWLALRRARAPTLAQVDASALPYTLDLDAEPVERVPALRATVGGKAAGFPILRAAGVTMPERPLAVTIRAYAEHLAELRPIIADALEHPAFERDARVRYLLLEGREEFAERFAEPADRAWFERFLAAHPVEAAARDPIAQLLARDGVKRAIRERPLAPAAAAALDAALRAHFGQFAAGQGLRLRSSSSVEDVEGFSGAGLYDSNTGFLDAAAQADKKDRKRTIEWALKKTWASYWSWEAFEERRMAGIDHLAGNMGVLVHARFDDPLERSNGVLTLTVDRGERGQGAARAYASMELDVQLGALSVTNPPSERAGELLPEVVRVRLATREGSARIERVAASTELPEGRAVVLDDRQVRALFEDALAIAERFLAVENVALDPARTRGRVTLDMEFRELDPGWPAYRDPGRAPAPARMVIKQVRSLDPGVPAGAEGLAEQPIPRELLLFADRVERRSCRAGRARLDLLEVYTDPMATPDLGHAREPFVARIRVQARGLPGGPLELDLDHRALTFVSHPGMDAGGPWRIELELAGDNSAGLDRVELGAGVLHLRGGGRALASEPAACSSEVAFASPEGFLRGLL